MSHSEEFWQNVVHWRRKWQPTWVFLPEEPYGLYEKANRYDTRRWAPRLEGVQYATKEEWRANTSSSGEIEAAGPELEWCSAVDVFSGESNVPHYKEQCWLGVWNARSMNQGKLDVVKQELARVNTDILGIHELKWECMCASMLSLFSHVQLFATLWTVLC